MNPFQFTISAILKSVASIAVVLAIARSPRFADHFVYLWLLVLVSPIATWGGAYATRQVSPELPRYL